MTDFCDIKKLAELLNSKKNSDSEDSDCEINNSGTSKVKIEEPNKNAQETKKISPYTQLNETQTEKKRKVELFDPHDTDYLFQDSEENPSISWKKVPKWEISYRQQVTSSDVFLQMGGKNPSTASCENMLVSVHLPGEHLQNIDLKILKNNLELDSPQFQLKMPLPHPVDPQKGNAQFDKAEEKLVITLFMDREFDFINF